MALSTHKIQNLPVAPDFRFLRHASTTEIPVDILQLILVHLDQPDLPTLCRVNKVCCAYAQEALYRHLSTETNFQVYNTLVESPYLAGLVRSVAVCDLFRKSDMLVLAQALRNMSSLRTLKLCFSGYHSWIVSECNFRLSSFLCHFRYDARLQAFLDSQPDLTDVTLVTTSDSPPFDYTCLPNISRIAAPLSWVQALVPNRPVSDVTILALGDMSDKYVDIDFLSRSTAAIKRLRIDSFYLDDKPAEVVESVLPSLEHLTVRATTEDYIPRVSGLASVFFSALSDDTSQGDLLTWLANLLSVLVSVQSFCIRIESNIPPSEDPRRTEANLPFITTVSSRSPHLRHFAMVYTYAPVAPHCWTRAQGQWVACRDHYPQPTQQCCPWPRP